MRCSIAAILRYANPGPATPSSLPDRGPRCHEHRPDWASRTLSAPAFGARAPSISSISSRPSDTPRWGSIRGNRGSRADRGIGQHPNTPVDPPHRPGGRHSGHKSHKSARTDVIRGRIVLDRHSGAAVSGLWPINRRDPDGAERAAGHFGYSADPEAGRPGGVCGRLRAGVRLRQSRDLRRSLGADVPDRPEGRDHGSRSAEPHPWRRALCRLGGTEEVGRGPDSDRGKAPRIRRNPRCAKRVRLTSWGRVRRTSHLRASLEMPSVTLKTTSPGGLTVDQTLHVVVWLARKDSNLRSPDPESGALPLGHSPVEPVGMIPQTGPLIALGQGSSCTVDEGWTRRPTFC
jgi:hypothetical protein